MQYLIYDFCIRLFFPNRHNPTTYLFKNYGVFLPQYRSGLDGIRFLHVIEFYCLGFKIICEVPPLLAKELIKNSIRRIRI